MEKTGRGCVVPVCNPKFDVQGVLEFAWTEGTVVLGDPNAAIAASFRSEVDDVVKCRLSPVHLASWTDWPVSRPMAPLSFNSVKLIQDV